MKFFSCWVFLGFESAFGRPNHKKNSTRKKKFKKFFRKQLDWANITYSTALSELRISALPYSTALSELRILALPCSTALWEPRILALAYSIDFWSEEYFGGNNISLSCSTELLEQRKSVLPCSRALSDLRNRPYQIRGHFWSYEYLKGKLPVSRKFLGGGPRGVYLSRVETFA